MGDFGKAETAREWRGFLLSLQTPLYLSFDKPADWLDCKSLLSYTKITNGTDNLFVS
jgi:hypothetical protein